MILGQPLELKEGDVDPVEGQSSQVSREALEVAVASDHGAILEVLADAVADGQQAEAGKGNGQ